MIIARIESIEGEDSNSKVIKIAEDNPYSACTTIPIAP